MQIEEVWKDIPNYEGLYQISNLGRVKSLPRKWSPKETILKAEGKSEEYLHVSLWKNRVSYHLYIHKCVAQLFVPNPNNYTYINHKDENKRNNTYSNLEWCTFEYNMNYGTRNERIGSKLTNRKDKSKPVLQKDLNGNIISEYKSLSEAHRVTGFSLMGIKIACDGGYFDKRDNKFYPITTCKGSKFEYKE